MNESIIYYQTRFYNDVFGLRTDFSVPTRQTKDKSKIEFFKKHVLELLEKISNNNWPHKENLIITVEIKGTKTYINRIDIDNTIKLLLDILKGIVYVDDKQIFSIMASKIILEKHENEELHGFLIGIRKLKKEERNMCIPPLMSLNSEDGIFNGPVTEWQTIEIK